MHLQSVRVYSPSMWYHFDLPFIYTWYNVCMVSRAKQLVNAFPSLFSVCVNTYALNLLGSWEAGYYYFVNRS